jgi:hypothetical protein
MLDPPSLRRSIGLRLAAAIELQNAPASEASLKLLRRMHQEVDRTANKIVEAMNDRSGEGHLIQELFVELHKLAEQPGGAELVQMVERLKQRIWPLPDAGASEEACSCESMGSVTQAGCLCDLARIRDFVVNRVRELYARQLDAPGDTLPSPRFRAKCVGDDSQHAYFGGEGDKRFGVNASTRVKAREIHVSIEFKPDSLDIAAAAQTLYLLTHETVCHAYQSLDEAQRKNSDDTCGWTDGWMDTLAWRLTERWIVRDAAELPAWLTDTPDDGKRWCRKFHERRYVEPRCPPLRQSDLQERCLARSGFDVLYGLWEKAQPPGADIESHRSTTFSILLNHRSMANETRRLLIAALNTALNRRKDRLSDVAGACSDFVDHRDPDQLLDDLRTLNGLPSPTTPP